MYQKTDDSVYLEKTKRDHKQTDRSILTACANFIAYFFLITISNGEVQVNSVKEKHTKDDYMRANLKCTYTVCVNPAAETLYYTIKRKRWGIQT